MDETSFDLIVIGGGPGGYVAAIRAAQLGMSVACVDKRPTLGGTCLNVGCIPSKALLHSSEKFEDAETGLAQHGITAASVALDLGVMMARKDKVVGDLTKGVAFLLRKNKITHLEGMAHILGPGEIEVTQAEGGDGAAYKAERILIATGSEVAPLAGIEIDENRIVSSTGGLSISQVPKRLVVIGGGYIGLELGSVWRRLGSEVTVVEFFDRLVPGMDSEIAAGLVKALAGQGMAFRLGTKVVGAEAGADQVKLALEPAQGGGAETLDAETVLVSVGRRPFTTGLGLEALNVACDERGFITVDDGFQTSVPGIYAIGDAIPGPMLAHKASDEGVVAVERMTGQASHVNYDAIPAVVYTWPEAATVGKTEEELTAAGTAYRVGKFPFAANSRARCNAWADGFVKIIADEQSDRVLGVHILGPDAGTMIAEAALAMEFGASAEDVAHTCHAHPTLNEAVKEAALGIAGGAFHI